MKYAAAASTSDETVLANATPEEMGEVMAAYHAFGEAAGERDRRRRGAAADRDGDHRARARRRDAPHRRPVRRDQEQLGGFYVVDVDSLDEALEIGGEDPRRRDGLASRSAPSWIYDGGGA